MKQNIHFTYVKSEPHEIERTWQGHTVNISRAELGLGPSGSGSGAPFFIGDCSMLLTQHWGIFSGLAKEWMTMNNVYVLFIEDAWMSVRKMWSFLLNSFLR